MANLPKQLSIVSYAVNGRGVGHLTRLIAIQRWVRRYATFCGVATQHWFLTTSEADTMLHHEGFAGFKLPSKSVVEEAGIDKLAYLALAKQWVWSSVALLRPDLFLVDTFPNGSFHELLSVLDLCAKKALVMRATKREITSQPAYRAVAGLYDRIICSVRQDEQAGFAQQLGLPEKRLRFVGPIMRKERFELLSRAEARRRLGIPKDARCWLVSAGGGGDDSAESLFNKVSALFAEDDESWLIFAAGPLYRGIRFAGERRIFWTSSDLSEYLPAVDAAISAGGFNAAHELMFAGVPAIFIPQDKIADDQRQRVESLALSGAARTASLRGNDLRDALRELSNETQRAAMRKASLKQVPDNHARDAALHALSLCLPEGLLEQARGELEEALLAQANQLGASLGQLVDLATFLGGPLVREERERLELDRALELAALSCELTGSAETASQLVQLVARKLKPHPEDHADEIASAVTSLMNGSSFQGQWSALMMLLSAWPGERKVPAAQLVRDLEELSLLAERRSLDLLGLTRLVVEDAPRFKQGSALTAHLKQRLASVDNLTVAESKVGS